MVKRRLVALAGLALLAVVMWAERVTRPVPFSGSGPRSVP